MPSSNNLWAEMRPSPVDETWIEPASIDMRSGVAAAFHGPQVSHKHFPLRVAGMVSVLLLLAELQSVRASQIERQVT